MSTVSDLCTLIVSDLHLSEAEPENPEFPLWKKFKTRQFFFDATFAEFLNKAYEKANGKKLELILNGDVFDFDSVTRLPEDPPFRVQWLEKKRGLEPRPERSTYKIQQILADHAVWVQALQGALARGVQVVFIVGNHDLELHFLEVQSEILRTLDPQQKHREQIRFCEWFYLSGNDTHVEHGNQYDPYCLCEDPINPFVQGYNYKSMKLPFGNLACRYMTNGMGFFNPHVDTNYIMSLREYVTFFFKYMIRAQPLLIWTWLWGALVTLYQSFVDRLQEPLRDPLRIEDRVNSIASKANADPRMVRELKELFVQPAASSPMLLLRELWLDRALLLLVSFLLIFQVMLLVRQIYDVSFFWALIPLLLCAPFFLFYSQSISSLVSSYKEPDERILSLTSRIVHLQRIVYGHTHQPRHEMIGAVEHLNSGTWSPAFKDVECTQASDQKTCVWIAPESPGEPRVATLMIYQDGDLRPLLRSASLSSRLI